jgi:hypothetical protein
LTDPALPESGGVGSIEFPYTARNLTMTIYQDFTVVDQPPLFDQVSREPQRGAAHDGAPPDFNDDVLDRHDAARLPMIPSSLRPRPLNRSPLT